MSYNTYLEDLIRRELKTRQQVAEGKKMFGGLAFMIDGKMAMGIVKDQLMARVGPEHYDEALSLDGCREMDFTGRTMKGFVYADPEAWESEEIFGKLVDMVLSYNPRARSSKN